MAGEQDRITTPMRFKGDVQSRAPTHGKRRPFAIFGSPADIPDGAGILGARRNYVHDGRLKRSSGDKMYPLSYGRPLRSFWLPLPLVMDVAKNCAKSN
jgi:hypothetical protein